MGEILEISDKMLYRTIDFNYIQFDLTSVLKKFGFKFLNSSSTLHEIELPSYWSYIADRYIVDGNSIVRGYVQFGQIVFIPKYTILSSVNLSTISQLVFNPMSNICGYIICGPSFTSWEEAENCLYKGCPIYKTDDIYSILTSYWNEEIYFN